MPACLRRGFSRHCRPPLAGGLCGGSDGPPAAIGDELRQARKGATVVTDSGAGVWLFESPPY